jgi:transposase-like protein
MPSLSESQEHDVMPKKITPELKTRAVRLVLDHRDEYSSITAAAQAESIFRNTSSTRRVVRLVMGYDDLDPPRSATIAG